MSRVETVRENLVIGGGLAGAMAAMRLATAGRDVVLLEKERGAHHKVCGEFLSPEAVEYLRQAGADAEDLGAALIDRLRISAGRTVVETRLPFEALSLSRGVLDAALLERLRETGCEVRRGVMVQRLSRGVDPWSPTIAPATPRTKTCPPGPRESREDGAWGFDGWGAELADGTVLRARNVFLATGKHDLRGKNRPAGRHGDLVGFKMHWRLSAAHTRALRGFMELFLFEGGYGGFSLVEGDAANLCLVVRRARLRVLGGWRELLENLRRENALMAARLAGAEPAWERPLAVSSIPYGYLCQDADGVWPVGDQAAVIPSFTGDGMAIALHSGALAAEMYLAGKSSGEYLVVLKDHLKGSMRVATTLSRAMVSRTGRRLAPGVIPFIAGPVGWIARSTRIQPNALEELPLNRPGFSLR